MTIHRYGLISDTHGHLHPAVFDLFEGAERIFHAGDVVGSSILVELETIAPTLAVGGNCDDPAPNLPPLRVEQLPFGPLVLTHSHLIPGAMARGGPAAGLARHFASQRPRVIVYGHTHIAYRGLHDGVWVVNPGPAGKPRLRDRPSVCTMTWDSERNEFEFETHLLEWSGRPAED